MLGREVEVLGEAHEEEMVRLRSVHEEEVAELRVAWEREARAGAANQREAQHAAKKAVAAAEAAKAKVEEDVEAMRRMLGMGQGEAAAEMSHRVEVAEGEAREARERVVEGARRGAMSQLRQARWIWERSGVWRVVERWHGKKMEGRRRQEAVKAKEEEMRMAMETSTWR